MADTTEQKALAIWSAAIRANQTTPDEPYGASCDAAVAVIAAVLKEHEAFRQEVSDDVVQAISRAERIKGNSSYVVNHMHKYIIAKPVDPLVEAVRDTRPWSTEHQWNEEAFSHRLRAAMKDRGYEWRKIEGEG